MKSKATIQSIMATLAGLFVFGVAIAGSSQSECDVVALNGSGTRDDNGVIVGSETLTVIATGEQIPVEFTAVPLGVTEFDGGQATFISSHDFQGVNDRKVRFTTFDEIRTIPLDADPTCAEGACGLVFKLVLEKGEEKY